MLLAPLTARSRSDSAQFRPMLLQRLITALVLLPLVLAAIWFAPAPWLYAILSVAGVLAGWEWAGLMKWAKPQRAIYAALTAAVLAAAWFAPARASWMPWLLGLACLWWIYACTLLRGFPENLQQRPIPPVLMAGLGLVLIVALLLSLADLKARQDGHFKLIYFLFVCFAADTGAYLAGRNFGKYKLAPNISPGKTREGAIGGLLLCALWALSAGVFAFALQGSAVLWMLLLSLVTAAISIVGDLTESMFKRLADLKDSGSILPGHGGMLDRVDSIIAAAPVFVLGLYLVGL